MFNCYVCMSLVYYLFFFFFSVLNSSSKHEINQSGNWIMTWTDALFSLKEFPTHSMCVCVCVEFFVTILYSNCHSASEVVVAICTRPGLSLPGIMISGQPFRVRHIPTYSNNMCHAMQKFLHTRPKMWITQQTGKTNRAAKKKP